MRFNSREQLDIVRNYDGRHSGLTDNPTAYIKFQQLHDDFQLHRRELRHPLTGDLPTWDEYVEGLRKKIRTETVNARLPDGRTISGAREEVEHRLRIAEAEREMMLMRYASPYDHNSFILGGDPFRPFTSKKEQSEDELLLLV